MRIIETAKPKTYVLSALNGADTSFFVGDLDEATKEAKKRVKEALNQK